MYSEKQRLGYIEGWISIVLNTLLFALKYWVGSQITSVSMVADAWHTLSDTLTSIVVIIGFWIMARAADRNHPFGHERAESISAIVIGVLLAVIGFSFFRESILRLINHQSVAFSLVAIIVFIISVVLKEGLAQFAFWAGKKIDSPSVKADGWHHRSDAIASALIVIGGVFGKSLWWMDGTLGIGVSLLILYTAYSIFKTTSSSLLGETLDSNMRKEIVSKIESENPEVKNVHHLHVHRYGNHVELTVHVRLNPEMNVKESHLISHRIENKLRKELNVEATVHVEPVIKRKK